MQALNPRRDVLTKVRRWENTEGRGRKPREDAAEIRVMPSHAMECLKPLETEGTQQARILPYILPLEGVLGHLEFRLSASSNGKILIPSVSSYPIYVIWYSSTILSHSAAQPPRSGRKQAGQESTVPALWKRSWQPLSESGTWDLAASPCSQVDSPPEPKLQSVVPTRQNEPSLISVPEELASLKSQEAQRWIPCRFPPGSQKSTHHRGPPAWLWNKHSNGQFY